MTILGCMRIFYKKDVTVAGSPKKLMKSQKIVGVSGASEKKS